MIFSKKGPPVKHKQPTGPVCADSLALAVTRVTFARRRRQIFTTGQAFCATEWSMFGFSKIFRSRWRAAFWATGILWMAADYATPEPPSTNDATPDIAALQSAIGPAPAVH